MSSIFDDLMNEEQETSTSNIEEQGFQQVYENFINKHVRGEAIRMLEDPTFDINQGDVRFSTALPLNLVRNTTVAIVGCGGLGNWQWRVLMGMGFRNIHLFDDDVVGIENIGPQAHSIMDLGIPKVEAVRRAGMFYRGVNLHTHQQRIMTYKEMVDAMGCVPDIVIGCTDSAEFRNSFIQSLFSLEMPDGVDPDDRVDESMLFVSDLRAHQLPKLWLDYRMSLGDWTCYAMPVRIMYSVYNREDSNYSGDLKYHVIKYVDEACFNPEDAVQEACTERAICYTGAQVASFTGAYVHWFLTKAQQVFSDEERLINYFENWETRHNMEAPLQFLWRTSFSARDFEYITASRKEYKVSDRLKELRNRRIVADRIFTNLFRNQFHNCMGYSWNVRSRSDDCTLRIGVSYANNAATVYPVLYIDGNCYSFSMHANLFRLYHPDDLLFVEHDYFLGDTVMNVLQENGFGYWMVEKDTGHKFCLQRTPAENIELHVVGNGELRVVSEGLDILEYLARCCHKGTVNFEHCEAPEVQENSSPSEEDSEAAIAVREPAVVGGLVDLSSEGFEHPLRWEEETSQYNVLRDVETNETVRVSVRIPLWAHTS